MSRYSGKILSLYDQSDLVDSPNIDSYKSLGVPYIHLVSQQRTQKIEKYVEVNGQDFLVSPAFVFARIRDKYRVIQHNTDSGNGYLFLSHTTFGYDLHILSAEPGMTHKILAVGNDELEHKVNLSKQDASGNTLSLNVALKFILADIAPRITVDRSFFGERLINKILSKSIETQETPEYDIMSEIRDLFAGEDDNDHSLSSVIEFYQGVLRGDRYSRLWIVVPKGDKKVADVFGMINRGLFGADADVITSKTGGNILRHIVDGRMPLVKYFGESYGPSGVLIVKASEEDTNVKYAARRTPTLFIMSRGQDEEGEWENVRRIDVDNTIDYTIPRAASGMKFSVSEIYKFVSDILEI